MGEGKKKQELQNIHKLNKILVFTLSTDNNKFILIRTYFRGLKTKCVDS